MRGGRRGVVRLEFEAFLGGRAGLGNERIVLTPDGQLAEARRIVVLDRGPPPLELRHALVQRPLLDLDLDQTVATERQHAGDGPDGERDQLAGLVDSVREHDRIERLAALERDGGYLRPLVRGLLVLLPEDDRFDGAFDLAAVLERERVGERRPGEKKERECAKRMSHPIDLNAWLANLLPQYTRCAREFRHKTPAEPRRLCCDRPRAMMSA